MNEVGQRSANCLTRDQLTGDELMMELCPEQGKPPLWLQLRNHPRLFCLHPTPEQLAVLLEHIAAEVERRGDIDYDRDPGETADWLRNEAAVAVTAASTI